MPHHKAGSWCWLLTGSSAEMSPAVPTYDFSVWYGFLREFQEQVLQQSQAEAEMPLMTLPRNNQSIYLVTCNIQLVKLVIKTNPDWRVTAMDSTSWWGVARWHCRRVCGMRYCCVHLWKNTFYHRAIWGTSLLCLGALRHSGFPASSALLVGIHYQVWIEKTASGY